MNALASLVLQKMQAEVNHNKVLLALLDNEYSLCARRILIEYRAMRIFKDRKRVISKYNEVMSEQMLDYTIDRRCELDALIEEAKSLESIDISDLTEEIERLEEKTAALIKQLEECYNKMETLANECRTYVSNV